MGSAKNVVQEGVPKLHKFKNPYSKGCGIFWFVFERFEKLGRHNGLLQIKPRQ